MDTVDDIKKPYTSIKEELAKLRKEKAEFLEYLYKKLEKTTGTASLHSKNMKFYVEKLSYYLENIIANIPASVYWLDKNNSYLGCNNYAAELVGLNSRHDIKGARDEELEKIYHWPPEVVKQFHTANVAVLKGKKVINREELPFKTSSGKEMYQLTNRVPLYDEEGEIIGVLGVSTDITDRKKMEIELKTAKEKAEEFNKLKSTFIQNMEHDIRTPASGLEQTLSILLDKEDDPAKKEIIQFSLSAAEELKLLLNTILNFDRLKYDNPLLNEPFRLSNIFKSIYTLNWPTANAQQLKFYYKIDDQIPSIVISDEHRVKHILLNLVGNALKFTQKGKVFFEAKLVRKKDRNLLIEFIIADTGLGIPEAKRNVIFERFVRLDDSNRGIYKGTGLGLSNVKEYVEQLGGEFKPIQSIEGKGTTFSILIPMRASLDQHMELPSDQSKLKEEEIEFFKGPLTQPALVKEDKPKASKPKKKTKLKLVCTAARKKHPKALLVEDSLLAQRMTQTVLLAVDCDLDIAGTAEEALEMINKNNYDLIFADIGLPGMDGIEMTRHIRYEERKNATKPIPIIGQSAQADATNKKACIGAGMQDLLPKPLMTKVVKELLQSYVAQYAEDYPEKPKFSEKQIHHKEVMDKKLFSDITRNNSETINNFITLTKEMLKTDVTAFEKAYQKQQWEDLLFLTHKLRGGFACIAAMRLEEACGHLEEYLSETKDKHPNFTHIKALYQTILQEIEKLTQEIKHYK